MNARRIGRSGRRSKDWAFASSPGPAVRTVWPSARAGSSRTRSPMSREEMTMTVVGRHVSRLSGYAPAVPTPFDDDGNVDHAAFEQFCHRQIQQGATALVVCGTTGEAPTLSPAEHGTLIRIAVGATRGRIPVIAGAGSNSTAHAIELNKDAEALGADAILSVVPYYN